MAQQFSCGHCGRNYAWKAEMAGKKVRCGCGHVMTAPQAPAAEPEKEDLYDLADDPAPGNLSPQQPTQGTSSTLPIDDEDEMPTAPPKGSPKTNAVPMTPNLANQNLRPDAAASGPAGAPASPMRPYPAMTQPTGSAREELLNDVGGSPVTELYVPAVLLGAGLMVFVLSNLYQGGRLQSLGSVLPAIGLGLLFNLVLSFAGIFMVAKTWDVSPTFALASLKPLWDVRNAVGTP